MKQGTKAIFVAFALAGSVGAVASIPEWLIWLREPSTAGSCARPPPEQDYAAHHDNRSGQGRAGQQDQRTRDQHPCKSDQDSTIYQQWIQVFSGVASLIVAVVVAGVALKQVGIYRIQTAIMRRQVRVSARQAAISERQIATTEALERPLVLPLGPRMGMLGYRDNPDKSQFPEIEMSFINHGRSPAVVQYAMTGIVVGCKPPDRQHFGTGFWCAYWIDDRGRRYLESYAKHFWTAPALPPGETLEWGDIQPARALDPTQVDELGTGHQTLWLDGVIVYLDVFGKSHETQFRWVYDYLLDIMVVDARSPEFNRYT